MTSATRICSAFLLVALLSLLLGCGASVQPINVALQAANKAIDQGQNVTVTATVRNDSKSAGVTWTVTGGGTLTNTTTTSATYVAPNSVTAQFTATVTATSVSDTTKSSAVQITVNPLPTVATTSLSSATAGTAYSATLSASGGTAPLTWSLTGGTLPNGVTLNSSTGVISGTPTGPIGNAQFTVTVTDNTRAGAQQALTLTVNAPPTLTITTQSLAAGTVGTAYSQTLQATGGVPSYTWSISAGALPTGLSLNAATGAITGTPTGPTVGAIAFTAAVTDSQTPNHTTQTASLSITINAPPLSVTTPSLAGGTLGTAYSQTLAATGGIVPYTWAISAGSLPAGLTLNSSTGVISGTPTGSVTGPISFTVRVTDAELPTAQSATKNLSITISAAPLSVVTTSLPTAVDGSAYSTTLQAAGGVSPYSWAVTTGSLPPGLSLNQSTGAISGTPTASGSTFTVTVTDSETPTAQTATKQLTITVNAQLTVTTTTLANGTLGSSYNQTLAASGGITPYSWAVTTGSLPAGLSLNSSTGVISGTPTGVQTGAINFTVTVTDAESPAKTASANLSITINAPTLTITTTSLQNGVINQLYTATLAASGGAGAYTWSLASGTLPPGLTLTAAGTITGTDTTATGTYNFTVQVTDSETPTPQTATKSLSISINNSAPLQITTTGLPNGVIGSPYPGNVFLSATGGIQPYTWSISAGSLPAGLSVTPSTGQIAGTPTATGTFNFTAKVTDSSNPVQAATANLSITVNAALVITTTTLPGGSEGTQYNQSVSATGGVQPYNWSISSGNLPTGLSLSNNNNNGEISGTPTATGTFNFTIQVTDNEGNTASQALSISISQGAPLAISNQPLPGASENWYYNTYLNASGGVQPYTWSVTSGSLPAGLLLSSSNGNISGTATALGNPSFTVKVTDNDGATATASFSIDVTNCSNNSSLKGNYALAIQGWTDSAQGLVYAGFVGSFVADGNGNLSQGLGDFNDPSDGYSQQNWGTGTYCVGPNNLGFLTIGTGGSGMTMAISLQSTGNGSIMSYNSSIGFQGSGQFFKQDTTAFALSKITGPYAMGLIGVDQGGNRFGVAGAFTAHGNANWTGGTLDADDHGTINGGNGPNSPMTFGASDVTLASNGRGTAGVAVTGVGTLNFAYYVVSASQLLLLQTDPITGAGGSLFTGQILQQSGTFTDASLNGVSVIALQDNGGGGNSDVTAGFVTTNGTGTFSISADQNQGGTMGTLCGSGDYSVSSNGRMMLSNFQQCGGGGGGGGNVPVFYLVSKNTAYVLGTDNSVVFGMMTEQTGSSFSTSSFKGNYYGGSEQLTNANLSMQLNQVDADGAGNLTGVSIENQNANVCGSCGGPQINTFTGTYTVASDGKVTVSSGGVSQVYFYIISTTQGVVLPVSSSQNQDSNPGLQDFNQ